MAQTRTHPPDDDIDSYVVRIYRRGPGGADPVLTGLVEDVPDKRRRAFHDINELWQILATPRPRHKPAPQPKPRPQPRPKH